MDRPHATIGDTAPGTSDELPVEFAFLAIQMVSNSL
jgi:hypothetical protein